MRFSFALLVLAIAGLTLSPAKAESLSESQREDVENVVRELLLKKEPDLIVKAAQEMQRRVEKNEASRGKETLIKNKKEIFFDPDSPVAGNPKGDVTIVEFFDYSCGYCKTVQRSIQDLLASDKNIRFVFKELPILTPASLDAAKAALASAKQGKYLDFHSAIMNAQEHPTKQSLLRHAKRIGLDANKLEKDMEDPAIMKALEKNRDLANSLGARGTPTFIIGDNIYPGALPLEQIKEYVAEARKNSK